MSHPSEPSTDLVTRLQSLLVSLDDVGAFLRNLADLAAQLLPRDLACGITMRREGHFITVASSDRRADLLDEGQYAGGDGPCLTAMRTGRTLVIDDLSRETRWPDYLSVAHDRGLQSSLSMPLARDHISLGAMNVYSFSATGVFGAAEQRHYQVFADQAALTLKLASRQISDNAVRAQLEEALSSRSVIDQAMGILVARHQLSLGAAFGLLRRQSQLSHRRLRDIAAEIVTEATGAQPVPGTPFHAERERPERG